MSSIINRLINFILTWFHSAKKPMPSGMDLPRKQKRQKQYSVTVFEEDGSVNSVWETSVEDSGDELNNITRAMRRDITRAMLRVTPTHILGDQNQIKNFTLVGKAGNNVVYQQRLSIIPTTSESIQECSNPIIQPKLMTPKIVTVGVGGAGNNIISCLVKSDAKGTEIIAVDTDKQDLNEISNKATKILIGKSITKGLGASGHPDTGAKAAEVDMGLLEKELEGAHLVLLCAGMGGGTGTGASPVIAQIAKEQGATTVAIVTSPFNLERTRKANAVIGITKLRKIADSVIVLDCNCLVKLVPNLPMNEAFSVADEILAKAIGGLIWIMTQPSMINIDFSAVRGIIRRKGIGFIAFGEGEGGDKVRGAAEGVLKKKLSDVNYEDVNSAIICISGGADLTLGDAIKAGEIVTEKMNSQACVQWGARLIPSLDERCEIVVIAFGVNNSKIRKKKQLKWLAR